MKVTAFLIKYGEIAIKGKNRYMFEDALMKQIRHAMAPVGDFKVRKESGRMFVEAQDEFDYDEAVEALQRVFGIVGICPMVIEENKDMEHLTETVIKFIDEQYPVKDFTFKVHARRGDKQFPLDSMAINMEIGGQLLDAFEGIKVDVHHPQVMVNIEVRKYIYIYLRKSKDQVECQSEPMEKRCFIIRRNRQSSCRIYDRKTWSTHRCNIFPCTTIHKRESKTEGYRSCEDRCKICRTDQFTCCKLYRHSVSDL